MIKIMPPADDLMKPENFSIIETMGGFQISFQGRAISSPFSTLEEPKKVIAEFLSSWKNGQKTISAEPAEPAEPNYPIIHPYP